MFCHNVIAIDTDAEDVVQPLFCCNASLRIPVMSILPTPDEVQAAVVKAVKLIVGSLKRVAQWSLTYHTDAGDADQRPTTPGTVITGTAIYHYFRDSRISC